MIKIYITNRSIVDSTGKVNFIDLESKKNRQVEIENWTENQTHMAVNIPEIQIAIECK